jgi:hypothetical protein
MPEILEAWRPIVDRFRNLSRYWNKPVELSEIGYCSGQCARNYTPVAEDFEV